MADRIVINGQLSLIPALFASLILGGIATFGLYVVVVSIQLGEFRGAFYVIAAVVALLFWVVFGILWNALGVWMIITRRGMRTFSAFGTRNYRAEGLRAGFFQTVATQGRSGSRMKTVQVDQLWVRQPGGKPRMISQASTESATHKKVAQGLEDLMGVHVHRLERDKAGVFVKPDFSVFDTQP